MTIRVFILVIMLFSTLFCAAGSIDLLHSYSTFETTELLGKNKWITAFLAFLGGIFGLHRWYMGHYKAGLFHVLSFLLTISAIQFILRGGIWFPIFFISLLFGSLGLEIIGYLKQAKNYVKPFQNMLLSLAFTPLVISLFWIGLIITFSGRSVYLILFTSVFTLFSLFLGIRYALSGKRSFIERFYKNRSIWH